MVWITYRKTIDDVSTLIVVIIFMAQPNDERVQCARKLPRVTIP